MLRGRRRLAPPRRLVRRRELDACGPVDDYPSIADAVDRHAGGGRMSDFLTGAGAVGYRKILIATSTGTLIEVYDILIYGYFATVLSQQFFPMGDPTAALLATFAIFAVGFFLR